MGLAGKPDPAIFLAVASRLHVAPFRAVVVEDAEAGVERGAEAGSASYSGLIEVLTPMHYAGTGPARWLRTA